MKKTLFPLIVLLTGALILVVSFFLPFYSAVGEFRESLLSDPEDQVPGFDMTAKELINLPIPRLIKLYSSFAKYDVDALVNLVIISMLILFSALIILFISLRKAIPTIVFTVLDFGALLLMNVGGLNENYFGHGAAFYIFIISFAVISAAAIWLLVVKIKIKKASANNSLDPLTAPEG